MSVQSMMKELEKENSSLLNSHTWLTFKRVIEEEFPKFIDIRLHTVYKMISKGFTRRMVVTKENQKTWVMYEVNDSHNPGGRWMVGKTWCLAENIWRDTAQSYELPAGLKLK